MKKFLAILLVTVLTVSSFGFSVFAEDEAALPTATVSALNPNAIDDVDLTFAMNFHADDATKAQLAAYGDWYADFELTVNKDAVFNANNNQDGYLAGQYDAWSENWVSVPFSDVAVKAGEPIKVMETAASIMGKDALKITYNDAFSAVKDFNCGVYFDDEYIAANPDLEVKLELRIYNPENEAESFLIGDTMNFDLSKIDEIANLPTASVKALKIDAIDDVDLTFAMNFHADDATKEQLAVYGDWYADFELTVNKDAVFNANNNQDGYLAGQYDWWSENWVSVPFSDVSVKAGEPIKVMETAASIMGKDGLKITYNEAFSTVKDFNCGVYFDREFIAANPDLEVKLELRIYNPKNEAKSFLIGDSMSFDLSKFSDDKSLKRVFTSGLNEVEATTTDYKYGAINGFKNYVIAAYTTDAKATVTGAVVDTLDADFAAANYVGSSIGISASNFDNKDTLYVVFKVTAENGTVAYHTAEIYKEAPTPAPTEEPSDDASVKRIFISGLKATDNADADYGFMTIGGFKNYVIAAYATDAKATVTGAVVDTLDTDFSAIDYVGSSIGITPATFASSDKLYVVFKVTAENGTVAYYTAEIINPKSEDVALKSLFISGFELGGNLSSNETEYNIRKKVGFKSYVFAARQNDTAANVKYRIATNGTSYEDAPVRIGAASNNAIGIKNDAFDYGDVIYVTIIAEDGVTEKVYTFNVVKNLD